MFHSRFCYTACCFLTYLATVQHIFAEGPLPKFTFRDVALHPHNLKYAPTSDLIHPTIIKTEGRIENPLGKYYLYFADHKGHYIRLAYADKLTGPWSVHPPGSLQIEKSHFPVDPPPYTEEQVKEAEARRAASGRSTGLSHSIKQDKKPCSNE